ncbi:hypothetical protein D3C81_1150060 [compost metagenome]
MEGLARPPLVIAEHVSPRGDLHQALMNMHRAARRMRQGLGHAHHGQAMLERDFLEQVLEQEGLVGQQQGVAVQQVDFELADAHFMHESVARQAQRRHALINLLKERPQAVVGTDTECRVAELAAAVLAQRRQKRLYRVKVGRKDEELQLGRNDRRQAQSGVTGDHRFE